MSRVAVAARVVAAAVGVTAARMAVGTAEVLARVTTAVTAATERDRVTVQMVKR
jgi:hypothetical protein